MELPNTSSRRSLLLKASLVTLTSPFLARNLTAIKTLLQTLVELISFGLDMFTLVVTYLLLSVCDWLSDWESESEPFSIFNLTTSLFKTSPCVIFEQSSDFSWLVLGDFLLCVTPFKPWHIGLILHVTWQVLSRLVALLFFIFDTRGFCPTTQQVGKTMLLGIGHKGELSAQMADGCRKFQVCVPGCSSLCCYLLNPFSHLISFVYD